MPGLLSAWLSMSKDKKSSHEALFFTSTKCSPSDCLAFCKWVTRHMMMCYCCFSRGPAIPVICGNSGGCWCVCCVARHVMQHHMMVKEKRQGCVRKCGPICLCLSAWAQPVAGPLSSHWLTHTVEWEESSASGNVFAVLARGKLLVISLGQRAVRLRCL